MRQLLHCSINKDAHSYSRNKHDSLVFENGNTTRILLFGGLFVAGCGEGVGCGMVWYVVLLYRGEILGVWLGLRRKRKWW